MNEFSLETRVYIEDTDAGGIVYYANYLKFMERARTEYMRALGFSKPALMSNSQLVVVQLDLKYLMPAMLDDTLRISVELKELKKASFWLKQQVYKETDLLIDGNVRLAALDKLSKKLVPLPNDIYDCLEDLKKIGE